MKKIIFFQMMWLCLGVNAQKPSKPSASAARQGKDQNNSSTKLSEKISVSKFTEGVVYSRTSFPGHLLNDSLKTLDFESGDFVEQYKVIDALKKHQKSIKGETEQEIKDAFFVSGMMILPAYSKMYFTPSKKLIKTDALGYNQETLLNSVDKTGKIFFADRNKTNEGTIHFNTENFKEVWQKYQIDAAQYNMQKTAETAIIAGYPCKKIVYTFGGTSRGAGASNYIINLLPTKVTAWYTDDLPPSINLMHTLDFELQKAILKFEVEYDKNKKNKMLVAITKIEHQKLDNEKLELQDSAPVVVFQKDNFESSMLVMQVMMNALSLLTK